MCNKNPYYIENELTNGREESKYPNKRNNYNTPDIDETPGNPEILMNKDYGEGITPFGPGYFNIGEINKGNNLILTCFLYFFEAFCL